MSNPASATGSTPATPARPQGRAITLKHVTKRFSGSASPAVADVSMEIAAGEFVVFVGPSGCGKTTTMRMINRLIEPTSGSILIGEEDVLSLDPNELRRSIGYSIQNAGLFPHWTIRRNVATVPHLLRWDKARIDARVDEILELVGLDPEIYADRYPRQLSGGQQQRAGVARALAANPSVLLMDEPFGAVDPVTRATLQDELLRIHKNLGTTIVFVTHDIAEALRLGDRIAVLGPQSIIRQFDTPEQILANPADAEVSALIGEGTKIRQLDLVTIADVELESPVTAAETDTPAAVLAQVRESDYDWVVVLDQRHHPVRWFSEEDLGAAATLAAGGMPTNPVSQRDSLYTALDSILDGGNVSAIVTGAAGEYLGVVSIDALAHTLAEQERSRSRQRRGAGGVEAAAPGAAPEAAPGGAPDARPIAADPRASEGPL